MRATINFKLKNPITLPIQYNHVINGAILNWIENIDCHKFIHDEDFKAKSKDYKLYTFSKLQGRFTMNRKNKTITYYNGVNLLISSYDEKFLSNIINTLILKHDIKILNNYLEIDRIETSLISIDKSEMNIYTKSPITVYNTFKVDGKNKTHYYSPYEKKFGELIRKSLINKYKSFYGKEPKNKKFSIEPLERKEPKESIILCKGIVIKGWNGEFSLKGSKELLNLAYQSGLGSKNCQGFGCIELIED